MPTCCYPLVLCLLVIGCSKAREQADVSNRKDSAPIAGPRDASESLRCVAQPFARSVELPEASGATLLGDGSIMVVGDSNTDGVYVRLDAASGKVLHAGKLSLDEIASDDLEGLSRIGDQVYAISSSGWMRQFRPKGNDFELAGEAYPLASYDQEKLVCKSGRASNCAQNYEGLCLRPDAKPDEGCAGFAAAKTSGQLICLRLDKRGRLRLDASHQIEVAGPKSLSGCHFDNQGRLWFGANLFAGNNIGFVEKPHDLQALKITRLGAVGIGFGEAIAVAGSDQVFRFSDTAATPSLLSKYICR